ncbi:MAG: 4Fe-4S binding protein [Chloroflexota bacterium]|nr:4Fe-4S binding protein [Chloroflexota bacterium]
MKRGAVRKEKTAHQIVLERKMVTHHDVMVWNLDYCVGCQLGANICPLDAITHVDGKLEQGRMVVRQGVDIDPEKCVLCGMCAVMCPANAIEMSLNGEPTNPVQEYETFPALIESNEFNGEAFDWSRRDFVIDNCPTNVISYDETAQTLVVEDEHCIRCRQCEVASDGAFQVEQPWEGTVTLRRELCVEDCFACADICPTRALHINADGELVLADYYCIKCGACMQICPIQAETAEYEVKFESQGHTHTRVHERITNADALPIWVERWRVKHTPVESSAWLDALMRISDEKAGQVEIDRKRALKRHDLLKALKGGRVLMDDE